MPSQQQSLRQSMPHPLSQSSQHPLPRIAFIGLGAMGAPMASCILSKGYPLVGYDASPVRMQHFAARHGVAANATAPATETATVSIDQIGPDIDVLVMILPNSKVSQDVVLGEHGIAHRMKPGSLVIDMTSGVPSMTIAMQNQLQTLGIDLIDAPVSGAVARAVNGTLTIMVGGEPVIIERARPILETMGSITTMGKLGSGHAMKALNNLVSCAGYLIGIEALIIGSKYGMDPEVMVDVLNHSTGMNNSTQKKFRQYVLSRKFDSGFPLKMMLKDIEIALGLAGEMNVPVPFARLCLDLWSSTQSMLGPDVDHTAMARGIEMLAGWQIPQSHTNCSATTT